MKQNQGSRDSHRDGHGSTVRRLVRLAMRGTTAAILLATAVLHSATAPAAADNLYVGTGCAHSTIALAIFQPAVTPGPDEIRVVNEQVVNTAIPIANFDPGAFGDLTIRGGYANCTAPNPVGNTIVRRTASTGPVFDVTSTGGPSVVTLERLNIRGGSVGVRADGAGAHAIIGDLAVVESNTTGVEANAGGRADIGFLATLFENEGSSQGGGILCINSHVQVAGIVDLNSATGGGGGLWASGCTVVLESGALFRNNDAAFGGGLWLSDSTLTTTGSASANIMIVDNTASSYGGGVYAVGPLTSVALSDTRIESNSAEDGGGIASRNQASVVMNVSPSCQQVVCSILKGNSSDEHGHAVHVDLAASVTLFRTHIEGSRQNTGFQGEALYARDEDSILALESVRYWDNHTTSLFTTRSEATIEAAFVSAYGNKWAADPPPGFPPLFFDPSGADATGNSTVSIYSSALRGHGGFLTSMPSVVRGECVIAQTVAGLTPITIPQYQIVADPLFVNPDGGNLMLQLNSPAIDFCDDVAYTPTSTEIRSLPRVVDLPETDFIGPYDLGAYEVQFEDIPLFADGFESGDTTAWE